MPVLEFKVVIIGAVAVGKTAIVNRIQYDQFEEDYQPTIGAGYVPYRTTVDGKDVKMVVKVGDTVLFSKYSGSEFKVDGKEFTIIKQSDILAIVE